MPVNLRPSYRLLLLSCALIGAWGLGFLMGGGSSAKGKPSPPSPTNTHGIPRPASSARAAGQSPEEIAQLESSALRRQPWTRERLLDVGRSIPKEGNIVSMVRRSITITDQLQLEDFPAAAEIARELTADNSDLDIFSAFAVSRWAQLDPAAAAAYISKDKRNTFFDVEGDSVWGIWASDDPIAAVSMAKGLPDESSRQRALKAIVEALARRDPASAAAFAQTHAPELVEQGELSEAINAGAKAQQGESAARQLAGVNQTKGLDEAAQRWANKDRVAALDWARSLPDTAVRTEALKGAYRSWFISAPGEAAAALLREDRSQPAFESLANVALMAWPAADRAAALAWADRLPKELNLADGYGALAERDGSEAPERGAQWLEKLPAGASRDEAVSRYAIQVVGKEGSTAMEWAHTIRDPAKRVETLYRLTRDWFNRDAGEAFAWLQNNALLSPAEKEAILKK